MDYDEGNVESRAGQRGRGNGNEGAEGEPRWNEEMHRIEDEAMALRDSIRRSARRLERTIEREANRRPYVALGVAAGVGFVLGGGLSPRVMSALFAIGSKYALDALAAGTVGHDGREPGEDEEE